MTWVKNITNVSSGGFRSLNGAADECIFQGKASKAGYYCFFKVWRDMPYDAVIDHEGILYRVEVKGSSGTSFDFSRGTRSGVQINRAVASKKRLIDRNDCDFVVGVNSDNGNCYIVPTDIVEILGRFSVSKTAVSAFEEAWNLFKFGTGRLTSDDTRDGLRGKSLAEVTSIYNSFGLGPAPASIKKKGMRGAGNMITDPKDIMIYQIWEYLANV